MARGPAQHARMTIAAPAAAAVTLRMVLYRCAQAAVTAGGGDDVSATPMPARHTGLARREYIYQRDANILSRCRGLYLGRRLIGAASAALRRPPQLERRITIPRFSRFELGV